MLGHVPVEVRVGEGEQVALQPEAEQKAGVAVLAAVARLVVHDPVPIVRSGE